MWTKHLFCYVQNVFPNICVNISKAMKTLKINTLFATNTEWTTPENG